MANSTTLNPLVIDTAGGSAILTTTIRVRKIRWTGGSTAGHAAVVQDQNGNAFWESLASGANYVEESDFSTIDSNAIRINGLKVPTLGSGKLYIYM